MRSDANLLSMNYSLTLIDVATGYERRGHRHTVGSGINATLRQGMLTCLLGANGSGKSTLLRSLVGFQPLLKGRILIGEQDISEIPASRMASLVGVVLTERPDVPNMTVRSLVGLGRSPFTGFWGSLDERDKEIVDESISLVGIEELAERTLDTLSDGERQKALIAKALAQSTPVILLDEPTAFLDYPGKADLLLLLRRIALDGNKTILMSTHDIELALQLADTLWLVDKRLGFSTGTPSELSKNGSIEAYFGSPGLVYNADTMRFSVALGVERKQTP